MALLAFNADVAHLNAAKVLMTHRIVFACDIFYFFTNFSFIFVTLGFCAIALTKVLRCCRMYPVERGHLTFDQFELSPLSTHVVASVCRTNSGKRLRTYASDFDLR